MCIHNVRQLGRQIVLLSAVVALLLVGMSSCGLANQATDVRGTLDRAIAALNAQPAEWRGVLSDTISQVHDQAKDVAEEIQTLYQDAVSYTGAEFRCNADFVGVRANQVLMYIRDRITGKSPSLPPARICNFNPDHVDLAWNQGHISLDAHTSLINVYGFDFRYQNKPMVELRDAQSHLVKTLRQATYQTPYHLQIQVQTPDFGAVNASQVYHLTLKWADGSDPSELAVKIPDKVMMLTGSEDFSVNVEAASGLFSGYCTNIQDSSSARRTVGQGWRIDRSKGDPGHPGVSEIQVMDNSQARDSLRGYNYQAADDFHVQVEGRVCGSSGWGPGAQFARVYRVYLMSEVSQSQSQTQQRIGR